MTELARRFLTNGSSFGPADPIAIEQFFTNGVRGGEERLMLAVLQDAVDCFQEHVLAQYVWEKKLFQEAEDWIFDKNTDWPFSFENICETLQLNPDYVRRGLLVWKEAKRKTHSANTNVGVTGPPAWPRSTRRLHSTSAAPVATPSSTVRQFRNTIISLRKRRWSHVRRKL
jgi:hypothetical protein